MKVSIQSPVVLTRVEIEEIIRRSPQKDVANALEFMVGAFKSSNVVYLGLVDDQPACVWGLIPPTVLSDCAYLWLLTTDLCEHHQFSFVRNSQIAVREMLKRYPLIYGYCQFKDLRAIKWIKWLGGAFQEHTSQFIYFRIGNG